MAKNILVLSKIYPADDLKYGDTPVVHYFAKQWKEMGYNVQVVHNYPVFPRIFYCLSSRFFSFLSSKIGSVIPSIYDDKVKEYEYQGIPMIRIPMKKFIPHGMFPDSAVSDQFDRICSYLQEKDFVPDVVVGHWWNPQLPLLAMFKDKFACRTAMVVHDFDDSKTKPEYTRYFDRIDAWGFRSIPLKKMFEASLGTSFNSFHCASGVPAEYVLGNAHRHFDKPLNNIIYVGQLIDRKCPAAVIEAVRSLPDGERFNVVFVGAGNEMNRLKKMSADMPNVTLTGKIPRSEVIVHMKAADIFVMISKTEAFGLVYLEAMGSGCITIASRDEGMDGIIVDGVNGFLCKAGDSDELAAILNRISALPQDEVKAISDRAVETANYYTDRLAAQRYINSVCE